ncbi:MAG: hypothetical protein ABSF83_11100 [Nitrososphaerales archaeon]|jgi:hypothetical protein
MLDRLLANALEGVTVIEDETGAISKIIAKQMGSYVRASGKKVLFLSLEGDGQSAAAREITGQRSGLRLDELSGGGIAAGTQFYGRSQKYVFLEGLTQDTVIIEAFSTYLFDKTEKEVIDLIKHIARLAKQKKSFIITYDKGLLTDRVAAYLRATADSVIIVRTELTADRVTRMLYIPKMRDSRPIDHLIKITIDQAGVQIDTREFVG